MSFDPRLDGPGEELVPADEYHQRRYEGWTEVDTVPVIKKGKYFYMMKRPQENE